MSNEEISAELRKVQRAHEEAMLIVREEGQKAFASAFKKLFEQYPDVGEVAWTQYTPYFMDGDPCEFGVHEVVVRSVRDVEDIKSGTQEASYWDDGEEVCASRGEKYDYITHKWIPTPVKNPALVEGAKLAKELVQILPDKVLESMFGDHVAITIDRSGAHVEDYDHE